MTDMPVERPTGLIQHFLQLPELVREILLAAFLLAIVLPPFQMLLGLYSASQIDRAHSLEFREQILELLKQRPDLAGRITASAE
ncbi:MAG: hypothetical protein K5821_00500 [Nitrobacter sp.]|uniref:hypothetical protein n=1 Tax=Nitrobacter sp. TaxID=29420 RepID=UPI002630DA49|nr:hypothetical protein [Nitrobacter sp.]MCV0384904.1 hypothetical protein [Nitrobacter sp.]